MTTEPEPRPDDDPDAWMDGNAGLVALRDEGRVLFVFARKDGTVRFRLKRYGEPPPGIVIDAKLTGEDLDGICWLLSCPDVRAKMGLAPPKPAGADS